MKLRDLKGMSFTNLKVCVSWTFNKGYDWEDILKAPEDEVEWLWDSNVKYFTKTKLYDLVISVGI